MAYADKPNTFVVKLGARVLWLGRARTGDEAIEAYKLGLGSDADALAEFDRLYLDFNVGTDEHFKQASEG